MRQERDLRIERQHGKSMKYLKTQLVLKII